MGVRASFSSGLFWENFWYGTVLVREGKRLSVFGFGFFRGATSAIFRFFLSFYSSQVPFFWKINLQSNCSDLLIR